ncbi:glycoside hydrolase family 88 protein [Kribbella sp. CA-245084]|uniref:glycoside hydrolase family 88 protein n=1 Tax=Kribbella sp. CA-245084 TaxID=3239940 RepID=UPI003D90AAF8
MRARSVLRRCLAALLPLLLLTTLFSAQLSAQPAQAELQHPRQQFLRESTGGLFLHWGMRSSPGYTSCSAWENAVKAGGWDPAYWVREAQKLHTQYLVLATFHSRLGYARPWPSKIPGSCQTNRDLLRETIDAAKAQGLKVVLYMTDDPQWHNDGLPSGKDWLDSAAYSKYKGHNVDLSTRDGFGEFSYDNFVEVMQRYPDLGGFWIDNDNAYWESHGLYDKIRRDRPEYTLSNNNEDTPIMDMISNEQKTGMSPDYDYPQAVYTAAPRLIEADFKLPSKGAWWYDGSNPTVDTRLTIGRYVANAGSSIKSLMAETAMVNGRFPSHQEDFNNLFDKYLQPIWPSLHGTEGGGYMYGGLKPGAWNDGAYGVTTVSRTDPDEQYIHVLTKPTTSTLRIRDNGYRIADVTDLRTGQAIAHSQANGILTLTGLTSWDAYDTVFKVESAGREGILPASSYTMTATAGTNPAAAADGNYLTYWDSNKTTPVSLDFDLGSSKPVRFIGLNQREDSVAYARSASEQSARIKSYRVYVSADGKTWGSPIKTGTLPSRRAVVYIDLPATTTRHVRLEVVNTYAASSDPTRYKRLRIDEAWIGTSYAQPSTAAVMAAEVNVKDYGAKGDGKANDSAAINKAIAAAAPGSTVRFPAGTYKSANSIHLKSHLRYQLDSGATILGASNNTYDKAEANPNDEYQDYGHSHFHDAMLWGDRLTDIAFTGTGTIDGGGHLITGNPKSGQADKIISLTRCDGLRVDGIRLRRGGHFAMLTNGCDDISSDGLRIETADNRDGWNIINAKNVTVTHANIAANDDALVFKSDWALGQTIDNGHVRVSDSQLSAGCCNALMFGSETCGNFTDYAFDRIKITGAGKSGLGMVSMDGSNISDVHYRDITMSGTRSPIMQKVGTRKRCGSNPGVGSISNITYQNVTGTYDGARGSAYSPTLWGEDKISDVTFDNVQLTVPGGNATMGTGVPSNDPKDYNPNSIGTRPSYGWYLHQVDGVHFTDSSIHFNKNDGRPAVIANDAANVRLSNFTAQRGTSSPYDLGFQSVNGYCVNGGSLRVKATDSSSNCRTANLENGQARTPPMGFNNWNSTKCTSAFNEAMIKSIADLFVSRGLKDAGYQYVNIDDCWALPQRNAQGKLVPDPARFPHGIKSVADYVHSKGLKFGLYTSAGTKTCDKNGFPGGLGHEKQDANLFASWGVDYLKYDNCNNQGVDAQQRYTAMRDALLATGRPITYSICEWGRTGPPKVWQWAADVGNLWRTTGDISDNWGSMIGKAQANRDLTQYAGPGHWNDPDMLEVGNGGMTATEYRTHFSLWAMMSAPLLIGTDLRKASTGTFDILTNPDVIAIDQDRLGRQATVVSSSGGLVVYAKTLANGDRAVALSNETGSTATISTTAEAIGLGGSASYTLKDLWSKTSRTTAGQISASVPSHATVMYRVSRAGTTQRYEAEAATLSPGSTIDKDHSGYSGAGFVNTPNQTGNYVEWKVDHDQAGPATLIFDHANGTTANRAVDIAVNGSTVAKSVAIPSTGAWTLWRTIHTAANLRAGTNTIRVTATTANGAPNLDYLDVAVDPPAALAATDWSVRMVDSTMARYKPTTIGGWSYPVGLYLYGQYLVYQRTHDPKYLSYVKSWVDRFVDKSGNIDNSFNSLDSMLAGRLLVVLHHETGDHRYEVAATKIRKRLSTYPRTTDQGFWHATSRQHQLWGDGVFMVDPFLAEYGHEFGDSAYTDKETVNQLLVYASHLQQSNGLLRHAYDESRTQSWADPKTGQSPEVWCRAEGWFGMATIDVLDVVPANQPRRAELIEVLRKLVAAYAQYQDPASGRWFQVVDKGNRSDNWTETSCSSMYTFVISRAVERGYVDASYQSTADRGYQGVLSKLSLGSDGRTNLTGISIGTNVGDYKYYVGRERATNDFHGLGAFLLMNEQVLTTSTTDRKLS